MCAGEKKFIEILFDVYLDKRHEHDTTERRVVERFMMKIIEHFVVHCSRMYQNQNIVG